MRSAMTEEPSCNPQPKLTLAYFSKSSSIGPSSRYRIYQFVPSLQSAGIDCRVYPLFGPAYFHILEIRLPGVQFLAKMLYVAARFLKRGWDLVTMPNADLVGIEGQLFPYLPSGVERLILQSFRRVVIEMDDAIYLTRFHQKKISTLLKEASASIVGNQALARYARQYNAHVAIVPTVVNTDRFRPSRVAGPSNGGPCGTPITVVWVGLAYNLPYLDMVKPALKRLSEQGHVRLRVICSRPPNWRDVNIEFRAWNLEREAEDLMGCEIGIMPLPDTEWARGKCGLKLLQYMACGMATVASPVGVNTEIVREGETGFLPTSVDDWYEALTRLCGDAELRARLGLAGRRRVEDVYSLQRWGSRVAELYMQAAKGRIASGLIRQTAQAIGTSKSA